MAGNGVFINIGFPFSESNRGFFLKLNNDDKGAIKSDLMHLILTRKGERLYMPEFGTNLLKYIFEPNDNVTQEDIKREINLTVKKYLPNLQINGVIVNENEATPYGVTVRIDYTVTDDVFQETDFVIIEL
jgi:phage baseplate assembly protein W